MTYNRARVYHKIGDWAYYDPINPANKAVATGRARARIKRETRREIAQC